MSKKILSRFRKSQQAAVTTTNEQILNFSLTLQETNIIMQGLGELPAKVSIEIINKIQMQAKPQLDKNTPSTTPEPEKKPDIPVKAGK